MTFFSTSDDKRCHLQSQNYHKTPNIRRAYVSKMNFLRAFFFFSKAGGEVG